MSFFRNMSFFRKWWAFFNPVKGWKKRLLEFKGGKTAWEVPGHPECNKVVPWPVEWIPHRIMTPDEMADATMAPQGFVFLPCTCVDSGKEAPVGEGVLCVRCGVPLRPECSNMISGFDPPYCSRCKWPLLLLGK